MSVPTEIRCTACGRVTTAADRYCGFCGARLEVENATPADDTAGAPRPHVDRIQSALRTATLGEYDIAGEIGRGGMALVFLAHDLSLNRKVAIKALLPELLYTEGMDRRFKHEARIAAKLDHPNILVIHAVREANELLFIVMKLVEGLPLSAIVKTAGPLPIPVVRFIVRHVAEALAYAHGEGVVHRDVKPANIMVDRRGNVVVMDFGIAKAADDAHLTRTGLVIGTPAYMSPEQCLAQGVAPASDQYSLGVVAYELLTGQTPFRGSALEMQWAHATAGAPTVRSLRPDCPLDLEALVLRMLAKAPDQRWPTLHDVSHALGDDATTANSARAALVAFVNASPDRRDANVPTTPASPVPIGPGPVAAGNATTDPVRRTSGTVPDESSDVAASSPVAGFVGPLLTLSQQRIELTTGDSVELIVELEAADAAADGSTVAWESSDPAVAQVSNDGFVTALGPGLAEITCGWRGRRAVCVVHVTAAVAAAPVDRGRSHAPTVASARDVAAPTVPMEPRRPEIVARTTPVGASAAGAPTLAVTNPRKRWWVGVLAAGLVSFMVYRGVQPGPAPADPARTDVAAVPTPAPATPDPVPPPATVAAAPPQAVEPPAPNAATKTGRPNAATATPPTRTATGSPANTSAGRPAPPANLPFARPDTSRLTVVRTDTSYAAPRTATPSTPAPTNPGNYPAAPTSRDSTRDAVVAPSLDVANALFRDFSSALNSRTYSRITAAYSQPSDAAAVKLWQDFLIYVRDYTPRTVIRSVRVDSASTPPTITATIDFRWSTDAGFERVRPATFVGYGLPATSGWQLHRVLLTKRFW